LRESLFISFNYYFVTVLYIFEFFNFSIFFPFIEVTTKLDAFCRCSAISETSKSG